MLPDAMIARHIHHALAQVRDLQHQLIEKQRFKGYSGRARAAAGCIALVAAIVMSSSAYPEKPSMHAIGWAVAFLAGFAVNFGALLYWFFFDQECKREIRRLKPILDVGAPFFAGAIFTYVFLEHGLTQLLPGTWMILFGLANLASRHVLPSAIVFVGLFYMVSGTVCLLIPSLSLTDPWPIGLVFFVGEWAAGWILHYDSATNASYNQMVRHFAGGHDE